MHDVGIKSNLLRSLLTRHLGIFNNKSVFFILCNLLFQFINNDINNKKKECHRFVFELCLFKNMHTTPFSPKMFKTEVGCKQVYDMVANNYGILWNKASEQLKFT